MAFRKSRSRRTTSFPRRFRKPLAKVRRTWFASFRHEWCDPVELPLLGCDQEDPAEAENDLRIILIGQPSLQAIFSDRCRVRRIVGDIWWEPVFGVPLQDPAAAPSADFALNAYQAFYGLRKDETSDQQPFGLQYDPIMSDADFSEAQWIKTWQHAQTGSIAQTIQLTDMSTMQFPVQCNDVHTAGILDNSFTNGTGTINIETDCLEPTCKNCENGTVQTSGYSANTPRLGHFHIDFRRAISLRENDQLMLQLGFVFPYLTGFAANQPAFRFFGGIKSLIEV